jgi:hypothetical protein
MDVITQIRLLWLGGLAALYGLALGTALLLRGWLQRREQRRWRLLGRVRRQFPVELRNQLAIQVRGTAFGRRAVVELDMGSRSPEAWWPIVTGVSQHLSPDVRRLVCRTHALPFPVTLAIQPKRRRDRRPCRRTRWPHRHRGERAVRPDAPDQAGGDQGALADLFRASR